MAPLKKILVADDEAGIRALLFDVLSSEGFKVTLAKDGRTTVLKCMACGAHRPVKVHKAMG